MKSVSEKFLEEVVVLDTVLGLGLMFLGLYVMERGGGVGLLIFLMPFAYWMTH